MLGVSSGILKVLKLGLSLVRTCVHSNGHQTSELSLLYGSLCTVFDIKSSVLWRLRLFYIQ